MFWAAGGKWKVFLLVLCRSRWAGKLAERIVEVA